MNLSLVFMIVYFLLPLCLFIYLFVQIVQTGQFRPQIAEKLIEARGDSYLTTVSDDRIYEHG